MNKIENRYKTKSIEKAKQIKKNEELKKLKI